MGLSPLPVTHTYKQAKCRVCDQVHSSPHASSFYAYSLCTDDTMLNIFCHLRTFSQHSHKFCTVPESVLECGKTFLNVEKRWLSADGSTFVMRNILVKSDNGKITLLEFELAHLKSVN